MKTIQIKGILIYLLTLALILGLGMTLEAQNRIDSNLLPIKKKEIKDEITVKVNITLNNNTIESDNIILELMNLTENRSNSTLITDNFTMFLNRHSSYAIKVTTIGFNTRTVLINTECPDDDNWVIKLNLNLQSDKPNDIAGVIYYDYRTLSFESKPYPKK